MLFGDFNVKPLRLRSKLLGAGIFCDGLEDTTTDYALETEVQLIPLNLTLSL